MKKKNLQRGSKVLFYCFLHETQEADGDGANEPVDNMPVAAQPTQGAAEPGSWVDQPSAISLQDEAMVGF